MRCAGLIRQQSLPVRSVRACSACVAASSTRPADSHSASLLCSHRFPRLSAGGYGEAKGRFNDVYSFDTRSHHWQLVPAQGDLPKPIYLHSAVQHGSSMIVFGGNNGKECNDMYSYDLTRGYWTKFPTPGMLSAASAQFPAARYGHASCVYGGCQLLIVGGCKSNNTYFKDAYSMNLETRQWRKLEDLPLDLAYHALFTWNNQAYLFGSGAGQCGDCCSAASAANRGGLTALLLLLVFSLSLSLC